MMIRIRTASQDDLPALAALHVAAWEDSYRGILPDGAIDRHTVASRLANFEKVLERSPHALLLAEGAEGTLQGFCHADRVMDAETKTAAEGEVRALYVAPGFKRQGLGTLLLDAALHRLRSRGCSSVIVWTLEELEGACRFYESCEGFRSGTRQETHAGQKFAGVAYRFNLT